MRDHLDDVRVSWTCATCAFTIGGRLADQEKMLEVIATHEKDNPGHPVVRDNTRTKRRYRRLPR